MGTVFTIVMIVLAVLQIAIIIVAFRLLARIRRQADHLELHALATDVKIADLVRHAQKRAQRP